MDKYCMRYLEDMDEQKQEELFGWIPIDIKERIQRNLLIDVKNKVNRIVNVDNINVDKNRLESEISDLRKKIALLQNDNKISERQKIRINIDLKKIDKLKKNLALENEKFEKKLNGLYSEKFIELESYLTNPINKEDILSQGILLSTTNSIDGYIIEDYISIESMEIVTGVKFLEFQGKISEVISGNDRLTTYENKMQDAKRIASNVLKKRAASLGGNAIIGMYLDFKEISGARTLITMNGTVAKLKKI